MGWVLRWDQEPEKDSAGPPGARQGLCPSVLALWDYLLRVWFFSSVT